jgi:transglutaminase-like putative cysteine protease
MSRAALTIDAFERLPTAARCPLALLALALIAHAPALSPAAWPVLLLALGSRALPPQRWLAVLRLSALALVYLVAGARHGWFADDTLRLTLLLVLALKWAESRGAREYSLTALAACVALAIGLLQWGEGVGLLLMLAAAVLLLAAHAPPASGWRARGRPSATLLLAALPLAAVLYLFFPRIPGPLWDIGLSFGLPLPVSLEKSDRGLGISTTLKPGQTQTGASDGQPVLIAQFAGWVPPTSLLYWRGPVFYDFDGSAWQLDAEYDSSGRRLMAKGWRSAASFKAGLREATQEVRYEIRLTPHGGLWLYGLDLPAGLTGESFIGPDWQVLAHRPVTQEMTYTLSSWLEWTAGGELDAALRERALRLPEHSNPQLQALGRSLAEPATNDASDHPSNHDIARRALALLERGDYHVRESFAVPQSRDALDEFWFATREGNAEFFACAYVVLMRAAGVPARLVTGYRGGKLMALTDYLVVKRSHAHAWVEIWDEDQGWRRIDPVDIVAPERFAGSAARAAPKAPAAPPQTPAKPETATPSAAPPNAGATSATSETPRLAVAPLTLPDLSDWLERWIFRLSADQQLQLLGGKGGGFAWIWLLAAAAIGSFALLAVAQLLAFWRQRRRSPPAQRAWESVCKLLAKQGLAPRTGECPSRFAERLAGERRELAGAVRALAQAYTNWRYARIPGDSAAQVGLAARFLANLIHSAPAGARPPGDRL